MADWSLPTLSDLKVDVMSMLKGREVDAYTLAENPTNPPVGAKRYNHSLNVFQSFNGTDWVNLVVSIAGGGTGASDINGFIDNFNLGSMALQDNNAVNITGGSISGLSLLVVSGGTHLAGSFFSGSASVTMTNSAGYLLETAIADGTIYTRVAANEVITGTWSFNNVIYVAAVQLQSASPALAFWQNDGATNQKFAQILADANIFELRFYNDDMISYTSPLTFTRTGNAVASVTAQGPWIFANGNIQIGSGGGGYIYFYGTVDQQRGIAFGTTPTNMGRIVSVSNIIHYDEDTHLFRSKAGAEFARITAGEVYVLGRFRSSTGTFAHAAGTTFFGVSPSNVNFFCDAYTFINAANSVAYGLWNAAGLNVYSNNLVHQGKNLYVGEDGASPGIRISKQSAVYTIFNLHGAGGGTEFWNAQASAKIMELRDTSVVVHAPNLYVQNGSAGAPSFSFLGNGLAGFYYNLSNPTVEFGARFNMAGGRSVMRCHAASAIVDFLVADSYPLKLMQGNVYVGEDLHTNLQVRGETFPRVHHGYWCGLTNQAFYQACAVSFTVTSDIRQKEVHGPITNVLDIIDDVSVFIASFREELRPAPLKDYPHWRQRFPSFSAQEVKEKIDDKWGTRIVDDTSPDNISMTPDRLIPVLWQAVKELYARVKALEP